MKTNLLILVFLCLAGFGMNALLHQAPDKIKNVSAPVSETTGAKAPPFTITALDGKQHSLADYEGKIVIVNFWATWCAPCIVEFPHLLEVAERRKDDTILLLISSDHDQTAVERFLARLKSTREKSVHTDNVVVAIDSKKQVTADIFQTMLLPETIIIDKSGLMRHKISRPLRNAAELDQLLADIQ
jgi:cytochrome c biogenesis protein CcmG/thiol:disulfide interchange protein DsbE